MPLKLIYQGRKKLFYHSSNNKVLLQKPFFKPEVTQHCKRYIPAT